MNLNVDSLRPNSPDSPATSPVDNFTVTVTFPEYGVQLDRIRFPVHENIDAVKIYAYRPGKQDPKPLNFDQVL